jgi:prepilin signal peptidase PulO-like enzyme (type II secretory pathway)
LGGSSLIFAFWIGAIFGILLIIFSKIFNFRWAKPVKRFPLSLHLKKLTMKSEIPFAPFIILSVFIVYCFRIDIFQVMKIFFNI